MGADLIATAGAVAALIGGLSGALCGGLIAHRLTLQRDRRKEHNERIAEAIEALEEERRILRPGRCCLKQREVDQLAGGMSRRDGRLFSDAFARYKAASEDYDRDNFNQSFLRNPKAAKDAVDELLALLKPIP